MRGREPEGRGRPIAEAAWKNEHAAGDGGVEDGLGGKRSWRSRQRGGLQRRVAIYKSLGLFKQRGNVRMAVAILRMHDLAELANNVDQPIAAFAARAIRFAEAIASTGAGALHTLATLALS